MKIKNQQGQTIIEAIVAIAIISIALVGFLSQSTYNYVASTDVYNRNIALNLAREGIEVIRGVRDSNWLAGCPDPDKPGCYYWDTGLTDGKGKYLTVDYDGSAGGWTIQFTNENFDQCVASEKCLLYINSAGFYTTNSAGTEPTKFFRQTELKPICQTATACGGDGICDFGQSCPIKQIGIRVISGVRWQQGQDWRHVELDDDLYNWR